MLRVLEVDFGYFPQVRDLQTARPKYPLLQFERSGYRGWPTSREALTGIMHPTVTDSA